MHEPGARRLAATLLLLAVDQAEGRRLTGAKAERKRARQEARDLLAGRCGCLDFWCDLAEVDEEKVRKRALTGSR